MRTFGELKVDECFVPIIARESDEQAYLCRKTATGVVYFGGIQNGEIHWVEERPAFPDEFPVQPVALEEPNLLLLQLFS